MTDAAKKPHRWVIALIWGIIWLPFRLLRDLKAYGWYGFQTPKGDRGQLWSRWYRRAILQGPCLLFGYLAYNWAEVNSGKYQRKWNWNPFRFIAYTSHMNVTTSRVIVWSLCYGDRSGYEFGLVLSGMSYDMMRAKQNKLNKKYRFKEADGLYADYTYRGDWICRLGKWMDKRVNKILLA